MTTQSRLERLVTLLDTGSTPLIRATAARQLGQIASLRVRGSEALINAADIKEDDGEEEGEGEEKEAAPAAGSSSSSPSLSSSNYRGTEGDWDQAIFLIARVLPHLRSKTWDTRVAAGQAIEAICAAAGLWDPEVDGGNSSSSSSGGGTSTLNSDLLSFSTFSVSHVLATGKKLLSSAGNEYDLPTFTSVEERLAHAKQDMQRLGLSSMAGEDVDFGLDVEKELIDTTMASAPTPAPTSSLPPPRFAPPSKTTSINNLPPPRFAPSPATLSSNGAESSKRASSSAPTIEGSHSPPPTPLTPLAPSTPGSEVDMSKLSARERNQLKRKRKMEDKSIHPITNHSETNAQKTRVIDQPPASPSPATDVKVKMPSGLETASNGSTPSTQVTHAATTVNATNDYLGAKKISNDAPRGTLDGVITKPGQWPFSLICSLLLSDLFSPKWEVRHGAALGLRELFKTQGSGGGKEIGGSVSGTFKVKKEEGDEDGRLDNDERHTRWCEDAAIRLLCVLSLDRLGDFVFDQVIAPVRETAGQTMASLLKWMPATSVMKIHSVLLEMVKQDFLLSKRGGSGSPTSADVDMKGKARELSAKRGVPDYAWEVRHAGLLGLKYEVTVRKDLLLKEKEASPLLEDVVDLAVICLRDDDDDVRSVAAATLLPVVHQLVQHLPHTIPTLMNQLWECLGDLKDDLSSSTGGIMDLLSRIVESPIVISHLIDETMPNVTSLVPRLFPFFRHTITSVRLSVLHALRAFLTVPDLPKSWVDDRVVRLLFQNLIVEEREPIREASRLTWQNTMNVLVEDSQSSNRFVKIIEPHLHGFFTILMTPLGSPIDFNLFYKSSNSSLTRDKHNVDKGILNQDLALVGVDTVIRGRLGAARALGSIMAQWPQQQEEENPSFFEGLLLQYLHSSSALQKCLAAVVVQEWAEAATLIKREIPQGSLLTAKISARLISILESPAPGTYAEMIVMLQRVLSQCQGLYTAFHKEAKVPKKVVPVLPSTVDPLGTNKDAFTIERARDAIGGSFNTLIELVPSKLKASMTPILEERRRKLIADIGFYQSIKEKQDTQVGATVAGAAIALQTMPLKLNPVIRSIMNSVKFEENYDLQQRSAKAVADFIAMCSKPSAKANPSDKIVKNLCAFVCQDTTQTAIFENMKEQLEGIVSLNDVPSSSGPVKGSGRGAAVGGVDGSISEEVRKGKLIRRGAELTLQSISDKFGDKLLDIVPSLWTCMTGPLEEVFGNVEDSSREAQHSQGQLIIDCCTLLEVNLKNLHQDLTERALQLVTPLTQAIKSHFAVIRSAASKSLAAMASCMTEKVMVAIVEKVVPLLGDSTSVLNRQGSIETISNIVKILDLKLLPYVIVLIVPILGRMSDSDDLVRLMATNTFASLVKMVPLEAGLPDPPGFSKDLLSKREDERKFLSQLLDGKKVEKYEIPVNINVQLRKYQQDGVNWMAFLAKFQLHGILCDDMGLGKTLQSICILSSKHHERAVRLKEGGSSRIEEQPPPSLIVCPPTLTGHWCHEIKQYANNLRPLLYAGLPLERQRLQSQIPSHDCIVMSYDTLRNDVANLSKFNWFYCILDEGHIIKSAKTKTTKAVKSIRSNHRLILSGTPIQNNVLELWSLFDFLMPGFLGSEKSFMEKYGRPILASRGDSKVSAREHERASLALEALHKQVLPFLLRRMKEDVLDDLPPKIIQDIHCDLGSVQKQLYDDFIRTQDSQGLEEEALESQDDGEGSVVAIEKKQHVFQTLQYLRKLVCHPLLVFDPTKPAHQAIEAKLKKQEGNLRNIENAPKLLALKQLLNDCGIGSSSSSSSSALVGGEGDESTVSQHRVLVFCQQKQMIDLIEKDLFKSIMPSVSYMRLDGSVPMDQRFDMVRRFNSDPSIDVLLLTTSVGGLGLTLTGADTVIFVEHDWNPMKDMQAMDRAHRLGQKKVVNVYRLITRNTLEEKIMGLQRFKINVAGSIVNQENKGMESMETDQILDLFDVDSGGGGSGSGGSLKGAAAGDVVNTTTKKGISQKALIASLEAMQDTGDDYADLKDWKA